jgi:hypothetical protein
LPVAFTRYLNTPGSAYEKYFDWTRLTSSPETDLSPLIANQVGEHPVVDKYGYTLFDDNGFEGDGWAQFVEAGGNTATNFAAIINMNSTSEFQYLAGDKYHDMLLLQEEIVAEDYQLVYQDTQKLVPEVIAFLEAPEEQDEDGYPVWTENQAGQDEGFSGVLT